jgi:hypothetical protein
VVQSLVFYQTGGSDVNGRSLAVKIANGATDTVVWRAEITRTNQESFSQAGLSVLGFQFDKMVPKRTTICQTGGYEFK